MNLEQLLADLGCQRVPRGTQDLFLSGVSIDSRQVVSGDLFVALAGDRTDGHQYVANALRQGAQAALISEQVAGIDIVDPQDPPDVIEGPVAILVDDTLTALQRLASARRARRKDIRVVGITGSVGKTTTKEAIAAVLTQRYETLWSEGNHNNEIGLPLTLMALEPRHSHAVLEMGMYDLGEIALLCDIARPQVAVVTNVRPIHLERLGTLERIAMAKSELPAALVSGDVAVLNGDDERVASMPLANGVVRVLCGVEPGNNVRAIASESLGLDGVRFVASVTGLGAFGVADTERSFVTSTIGLHTVSAALLAIGVGLVEGLSWDEIERGLLAQGHGLRLVPRVGRDGIQILDDSYNAGPSSMKAALAVLSEMPGRHVAVLGDMLELGAMEDEGHREVGRYCAGRVDLLVTVGPRAAMFAHAANGAGLADECIVCLDTAGDAVDALDGMVESGDVVLVKGSRSVGLEVCVKALGGPNCD